MCNAHILLTEFINIAVSQDIEEQLKENSCRFVTESKFNKCLKSEAGLVSNC